MITYIDSSLVVRAYLPDEPDHEQARTLLDNPAITAITGSWTRVEVTSALVRAARAHRGDEKQLIDQFEIDVNPRSGTLELIDAEQAEIEGLAFAIVRRSGIRSWDAWHLACAQLAFGELAEPGEEYAFATRDREQATAARELGFTIV